MGETPWDPESYALEIREEIPRYDELQQRLVEATKAIRPDTILELGTGAGGDIELAARGPSSSRA